MINNNDIKKASENFYIKKDELLTEIISSESKVKKPRILPLRRAVAAFAAAVILFAGCVTAYAVSPEIRNYINLWFMGNSQQKEEVPEGYTGIYTIEDLDNIRNNLDAKYILMNDLAFSDSDFAEGGAFEGGWAAIGDDENPFTGEFDGNGHIISNITLKQGETYTGLFGAAGYNIPKDKKVTDHAYDGIIKNLGINGVKTDLKISKSNYFYIGSVIAFGNYVTGCYAENVLFKVSFPDFKTSERVIEYKEDGIYYDTNTYYGDLHIGGICGKADLIDSCYADIDIRFTDENNIREEHDLDNYIVVGGVAGLSCNIVTSYYTGNITLNGNAYGSGEVLNYNTFVPFLISEKRFNELFNKLTENYPGKSRDIKQFQAFYQKKPAYIRGRDLLMREPDNNEEFYVLERLVTKNEMLRLEQILLQVFDKEDVIKGSWDDGVKSGINFCYTLDKGKSYDQSYFENFNFENIWVMKDGVPKLRIFG